MKTLLKLFPLLGALTFFLGVATLASALFVHAYGVPSLDRAWPPRPVEPATASSPASRPATVPALNG